jgi:hypothetical protein
MVELRLEQNLFLLFFLPILSTGLFKKMLLQVSWGPGSKPEIALLSLAPRSLKGHSLKRPNIMSEIESVSGASGGRNGF